MANPIRENRALEERIPALTDQVKTSEGLRTKLAEDNTELEKVVTVLGQDIEKWDKTIDELKQEVSRLSKDNDDLKRGLAEADAYIKESEAMSRASWNAMKLTCDFLTGLGVHSLDPRHKVGDGLKSLGWIVTGFRTAAAVVEAFRDHCARVAWTGALHLMHRCSQPDRKEVKAAAMELRLGCQGNLVAYVAMQNNVDDFGKTFGHEFWRAASGELSRLVAAEAAHQVAGGANTSSAAATSRAPGANAAAATGGRDSAATDAKRPGVTEEQPAPSEAAHPSPP